MGHQVIRELGSLASAIAGTGLHAAKRMISGLSGEAQAPANPRAGQPSDAFPSPYQTSIDNTFRIPVFLSSANQMNEIQMAFFNRLILEMENALLFPRTLPRTEQYPETTLTSVRRVVYSSYGLLAVDFQRFFVQGIRTNVGEFVPTTPFWEGSAFAQIEPSMAYQYGLPLLLVREIGTDTARGIWERGNSPFIILEWDSTKPLDDFFQIVQWRSAFANWNAHVRNGYYNQTEPPFRYLANNQDQ
ncbi:hypothetical protein LRR81_08360 [Metabacillus sp. GX 13764]|uniref:hypothetical protein n=1 Tax=Metabacillus kandeliae TaxID=2900151 RepID=UPI001E3909A3|nr:hypothetical protein [Metabacillus kandeliae]MCD7034245.1 hypothetical protein [Metabacillus kandeliae]